jgi:hypothetical protein
MGNDREDTLDQVGRDLFEVHHGYKLQAQAQAPASR